MQHLLQKDTHYTSSKYIKINNFIHNSNYLFNEIYETYFHSCCMTGLNHYLIIQVHCIANPLKNPEYILTLSILGNCMHDSAN